MEMSWFRGIDISGSLKQATGNTGGITNGKLLLFI
jgi:hypothetical protein